MKGHRGQNQGPNFSLLATPGPSDILRRERERERGHQTHMEKIGCECRRCRLITGAVWIHSRFYSIPPLALFQINCPGSIWPP